MLSQMKYMYNIQVLYHLEHTESLSIVTNSFSQRSKYKYKKYNNSYSLHIKQCYYVVGFSV